MFPRKHRLSKKGLEQHAKSHVDAHGMLHPKAEDIVVQDMSGAEVLRIGTLTEADYTDVRGISATTGATITLPGASTSDGAAPSSSPTPTVTGGISYLAVTWTAIANNDPVTYDVHLSTTSGFTASAATLVGSVRGTVLFVRTDATGTQLQYDTAYYIVIIARDNDGSAAQSAEAGPNQLDRAGNNDILVDSVLAGTVWTQLLDSNTMETASSGQRVVIDALGIHLIGSSGGSDYTIVDLPTTSGATASFNGDIEVNNEIVHVKQTLEGILECDQGSYILLDSYQSDPGVAPVLTEKMPTTTFNSASSEAASARRGLWWDGTYFCYLTGSVFATQYLVRVNTSGTEVDRTALTNSASNSYAQVNSIVKIGSYWYALGYDSVDTYRWYIWGVDGSGLPTGAATQHTFVEWNGWYAPHLTTDGTSAWVVDSSHTASSSATTAVIRSYSVSTTAAPTETSVTTTSESGPGASDLAGFYVGNADYGAARRIIMTSTRTRIYVHNSSGVEQTGEEWKAGETPSVHNGLTYDGTNFWMLSQSSKVLYKFTAWLTGQGINTQDYAYAFSWNDSNATGGTHESALSPRAIISLNNRRGVGVTWPTIPGAGGTNDPDSTNVYAKQSSTDPGTTFGNYFEQSMTNTGSSVNLLSYSSVTAGTQDTAFSAIGGTPAYISPGGATSTFSALRANGNGFFPVGSIMMWPTATPPTGWLLCDGSTFSSVTYPNLAVVLGDTYATHTTTTYTLPDFRGMFVAGVNGTTPALGPGSAGAAHVSAGGHAHDAHGVAIPDHATATNTTTGGTATRVTGGSHSGFHASGGAHQHDAHTFANANLPPVIGINFIIKTD